MLSLNCIEAVSTRLPRTSFFVLLLLAGTLSAAMAQTDLISGVVIDADTHTPLKGASVQVAGPSLEVDAGAISNDEGKYAIEKMPPGRYSIKVTYIGYLTQTVDGVKMIAGQSIAIDFALTRAPVEFEEIVVSVSRRPENIIDASASIVKVGWEEARRNAADNSYTSLLKNVKGIDYTQTGMLTEAFNTRGFNAAFNTRMVMLLDGIPIWLPAAFNLAFPVPRDDIQNIEVLVGPGSALYGPDAVAGVVNIATRDPAGSQGTTLAVAGGSRSTFKGRLRHAGVRKDWGWKVSGDYQRARDFEVVNTFYSADSTVSATDDPDFDTNSLRGNIGLSHSLDGESGIDFAAGGSIANFIDLLDTGRAQRDDFNADYQRLTYHSSRFFFNIYRAKIDGSDDFLLHTRAKNRLAGYSREEARRRSPLDFASTTRGMEARYSFTPSLWTNSHFNVGTDLRKTKSETSWIRGTPDIGQVGLYGHGEIDLDEKFRLVLSARTDFHELYDTQISPKAGLIYKPGPATAFRLTFNRAFRNPGIIQDRSELPLGLGMVLRGSGEGFAFGTATGEPLPAEYTAGIPELEPEKNTTVELGCKSILAGKLFLDISGYRSRYSNFIIPLRLIGNPAEGIFVLDENGIPREGELTVTYLNYGEQVVWGLDLGVNAYVSKQVLLKSNASLIKADDLKAPEGIDQPFNTPGAILNAVLSLSDLPIQGSTVDLALRHVSEFDFRTAAHVGTVPAYTVADLNLGYRMPNGVTYKLTVKNILDNDHVEMVDGARIGRLAVGEIEFVF